MKKLGIGILFLAFVAGGLYLGLRSNSNDTAVPEITATKPAQEPATTASPGASPVANLNADEIQKLTQTVLQESSGQEARRKALYTLTTLGEKALPSLASIALSQVAEPKSQDPHSAEQMNHSFEIGLRVTAIESLDTLAETNPSTLPEVKKTMEKVLETQKTRTLSLLAQISLSGINSGRPGKVKRAVDQLMQQ